MKTEASDSFTLEQIGMISNIFSDQVSASAIDNIKQTLISNYVFEKKKVTKTDFCKKIEEEITGDGLLLGSRNYIAHAIANHLWDMFEIRPKQ